MKARHQTSFLFDLDGTLVDSVYDHVLAWHGNMSRATILSTLERLIATGAAPPCVAMAFGPGLTAELAVLT